MGVLGLFTVVNLNGLDQSEEEMVSLLPYETDDFDFVYKNLRNSIISRKQHSSRETTGDESQNFWRQQSRQSIATASLHYGSIFQHGHRTAHAMGKSS